MSYNPFVIAFDQLSRTPAEVRRRQRQARRPQGLRSARPVPGRRSQ